MSTKTDLTPRLSLRTLRTREALLLILALSGPLHVQRLHAQLRAWGMAFDTGGLVRTYCCELTQAGHFVRVAKATYALGPEAPFWTSLLAQAPAELQAQWRAELGLPRERRR